MRPFGSHKVYLSIPLLSTREEILPKMQDSDTYLLSSQLEIKYDVNSTAEKDPGIPFNLVVCDGACSTGKSTPLWLFIWVRIFSAPECIS